MHVLSQPTFFDCLEFVPDEFGVGRRKADRGFVARVAKGVNFKGLNVFLTDDIAKYYSDSVHVVVKNLEVKSLNVFG